MVTYSSLKDAEKPSLGVSCSSFESHVSIIDAFPFLSPQVETEKHPEMMPPENWTERRKRVWTPDHDGHCMAFKLCYYYEQAGWCLALGRHFARDGEDRSARPRRAPDRTDSSRAHTFLFLLYTDRGWLLWYRLYSTDRIGSFFSSWSSSSLSLLSSHACCICRPWMCWVPTSYCLLFSSSHYLGGKRKVILEKRWTSPI